MPLLSTMAAVLGRIPYDDLRVLGAPLAWTARSLLGVRRAHVEASMQRAGVVDVPATAAAMYASLATGVMELLWLAGDPGRDVGQVVAFAPGSRERLADALGRGRGAVLAASHTGNWELAACALARLWPLSVMVKPVTVKAFDRFMYELRVRRGVRPIHGEGALARALRAVRSGETVAMLVDQAPDDDLHAEWVPFLGQQALVDRAAATLAASAGAPLVVTASRRAEDGRHLLHVLSVNWPPPRNGRGWARQATEKATTELAAFVRAHPDQWLWLHRRWKAPHTPGTATGPLLEGQC